MFDLTYLIDTSYPDYSPSHLVVLRYTPVRIIIPALLATNFRPSTKALSVSEEDFEIVASSGLSFAVYLLEKRWTASKRKMWGSRFAKDDGDAWRCKEGKGEGFFKIGIIEFLV